jgi:phage-related protein
MGERLRNLVIQQSSKQESIMRFIAIAFALVLSACSTVESTIDGTGGIIKGVGSDVFGITAGVLDVTSNVIKDVADKTGTDATSPEETK